MPTFRTRLLATASGVNVHNVLHVTSDDSNEGAVAKRVANAWRAHIVPMLHVSYAFQGAELMDIGTESVGAFETGTGGAAQGGDTQTVLPTWVCVSVRLRTGRRGRSGAGRIGLGPVPEIWTGGTGNSLTSDATTLVNGNLTAFITALGNATVTPAVRLSVVSYYKGVDVEGKPIKRPEPIITPVEQASVNALLGSRLSRHPNR